MKFIEVEKMSKKQKKDFYKKNRVDFGMNTGTIIHKGKKEKYRSEGKKICRQAMSNY